MSKRVRRLAILSATLVAAAFVCRVLFPVESMSERLRGKPVSVAVEVLGQPDEPVPVQLAGRHHIKFSRGEGFMHGMFVLTVDDGVITDVGYWSR